MRFSLLLLSCAASCCLAASPGPASKLYAEVSAVRERHSSVIFDRAEASEDELRQIIEEVGQSLQRLDGPEALDLAEGNPYLRYRRYNLLNDLRRLHARLGDDAAALADWRAMQRIDWFPLNDENDPDLMRLRGVPAASSAAMREDLARRLGALPAYSRSEGSDPPSVAERISGLSTLWSVAREHFVWFDQVPELDWDAAYHDAIPRVIDAHSIEDYYRVLQGLVAKLQDGHSNVYPPESLRQRLYARPPLIVRRIDGAARIVKINSPTLAKLPITPGDEIVQIDGVAVEDYVTERILPQVSASTPQDRELRAYGYQLLQGDANKSVTLTLLDQRGRKHRIEVARSGYSDIQPGDTESFTLREDGVAILVAKQFGDDAALRLMQTHWNQIATARGLILDLRGNGGGSSNHGWDLLTYVSEQPIPTTRSYVREPDALGRARGGQANLRWRSLDPGSATPTHTAARDQHFDGPVAVLIDAGTFSAGEDTAASFALMKRGPIVGRASGGSSGQPLLFDLPGGGVARICIKRDEYPDGGSFVGEGVQPTITVNWTESDLRRGRDPDLSAAIKALRLSAQ
ncbi:S41 family peptidase [Pseudomarimonas arenosa]|uniref:Tail specific protease domain-containing protein n=1 Tax=Pseudomarimonas arenosa TaxID=2774145 RepID=A0AAW3ZN30_9GAMM|nr:S41 family peptidase [Pseudomarimonas arenosa]MBD8525711.1 hypothetical protein [Pseudomarimonas arenosa]